MIVGKIKFTIYPFEREFSTYRSKVSMMTLNSTLLILSFISCLLYIKAIHDQEVAFNELWKKE